MRSRWRGHAGAASGGLLAAWLAVSSCGSDGDSTFPGAGSSGATADGSGAPAEGGGAPSFSGDASSCVNLACKQVSCSGGAKTSLSGTVYDPAGKVPLYNVIVYVPNAPLVPIVTGATCDKCGGTVSGSPLVSALTDASGRFVLDDVPVGQDIPLVLQVGKWRRRVTIPAIQKCVDNPIADRNLTRLPRNRTEGDIPLIALSTGGADPLECLLRKIGLDDSEFTTETGPGRVHLFAGYGNGVPPNDKATSSFSPALNAGAAFGDAESFWSDPSKLKAYDIVLLSCEGTLNVDRKPQKAREALYEFVSRGGRVFASHWHRYWFHDDTFPSPFPSTGTWVDRAPPVDPPTDPITAAVDVSFPKGLAFRDWLVNVQASTTPGQLVIREAKHNVDGVDTSRAQQWITLANPLEAGKTAVEYMSFNTPVGVAADAQCGRVVYSGLHVSSGDLVGRPFPTGCASSDLSPQEKALEFMLFDLSSCIQRDADKPTPPR